MSTSSRPPSQRHEFVDDLATKSTNFSRCRRARGVVDDLAKISTRSSYCRRSRRVVDDLARTSTDPRNRRRCHTNIYDLFPSSTMSPDRRRPPEHIYEVFAGSTISRRRRRSRGVVDDVERSSTQSRNCLRKGEIVDDLAPSHFDAIDLAIFLMASMGCARTFSQSTRSTTTSGFSRHFPRRSIRMTRKFFGTKAAKSMQVFEIGPHAFGIPASWYVAHPSGSFARAAIRRTISANRESWRKIRFPFASKPIRRRCTRGAPLARESCRCAVRAARAPR